MLRIHNLTVTHKDKKILHKVNFDVQKHEIFALLGESGSGKSITCLSILKLLNPNFTFEPDSQILFNNQNLLDIPLDDIRGKEIAYIPQEPLLNPTMTVYKQIQEVFLIHHMKDETDKLLKKLNMHYVGKKTYPHELSGGQKQMAMIAMAVALKPKLIIADEPTTSQDPESQKMILDHLKALKRTTSILLVTHDFSAIQKLADRIGIMKNGSLIEIFKPTQKPVLSYSKQLVYSDPEGKAIVSAFQNKNVILAVNNLSYQNVFKDLSFQVSKGETLGIMGKIGAGKTTLAMILSKITPATSGDIIFKNQNITRLKESKFRPMRSQIQLIMQTFGLNPLHTVSSLIKEPNAEIDEALYERLGLTKDMLSLKASKLSGGQKQRVALYRALRLKPELLILDEPTASLDRIIQKEILALLKELQKELGLTYIFISHDKKVLKSIAHDVITLPS